MSEEEDDTIYIQMAMDEHEGLHDGLAKAIQSMEWISDALRACMHDGKSAAATLLTIKSVVDEHEAGLTVLKQRNVAGDIVVRHVVRP